MVEKLTKRMRLIVEGPAFWLVIFITVILTSILLAIGTLRPKDVKEVLPVPPAAFTADSPEIS